MFPNILKCNYKYYIIIYISCNVNKTNDYVNVIKN